VLLPPLLVACSHAGTQDWEGGFDGTSLARRWRWRVPVTGPAVSLTDRPGWLRIRLPEHAAGHNHWNEPEPVDEAPQLRAAVPEGDWEIEAHVHVQPAAATAHFQVGLVAVCSDSQRLCFGPFQGPTLPGGAKVPEAWPEPTGLIGFSRVAGEAREVSLRLARTGALRRAQLSRDGKAWVYTGGYLLAEPPRFVGLIGKTFAGGAAVTFDAEAGLDNAGAEAMGTSRRSTAG
jgi:hypothetical protein